MCYRVPMVIEVLVGGAVVVALGAGAWVYTRFISLAGRAKRALRRAPLVDVAQAEDGQLAKLVGRLRYDAGRPPLVAPLSRRACAYYRAVVEQILEDSRKTIIDTSDFLPFFWLEDESGRARVELGSPTVILSMDAHFSSGFLADARPHVEEFLAAHDQSSTGWVFNKSLRYREGVLEEGEQVAVCGLCRWEPDPDPTASSGYRHSALRLRVVEPLEGEMVISDVPALLAGFKRAAFPRR
jgi:hypothetical protein